MDRSDPIDERTVTEADEREQEDNATSAETVRALYLNMQGAAEFKLECLESITLDRSPQWLIEGLMPATGIHVLYGAPGTGKSFLALNAALHVAAGLPWAGRDVKAGQVVYVASEGGRNFRKRVVAAKQALGLCDDTPFALITTPPKLGGPLPKSDAQRLIQRIKAQGYKPRLIVLDTLSRSVEELNESSSQDIMTFVRDAEEFVKAFECLVMPVHHCGKDETKGMRGSSALHGSADAEWMVARKQDTGTRLLTVEKMKDGPDKGRLRYDLENVELGRDEAGHPILTCFAKVFSEAPVEQPQVNQAGEATQESIISALVKTLAVIEGQVANSDNVKVVLRSRLLDVAMSANLFPGKDQKYVKTIIKRALKSLSEKGTVHSDDETIAFKVVGGS